MIDIYNYTYTQMVAKLANSDIIHIIIAIHYLHVYTIIIASCMGIQLDVSFQSTTKSKEELPTHLGLVTTILYCHKI